MQVASVSTSEPTMRSEIEGWTFEDGTLLVRRYHSSNPSKISIGYTPSPKDIPFYTCVLEMLADGWKLLSPPQHEEWTTDEATHAQWGWWLQRESPSPSPTVSDPRSVQRQEDDAAPARENHAMTVRDVNRLAEAIRGQVEKFSDRRLNDGDDVWEARELELRCGVAATANAICVALKLDPATFAAACGLHVSTGRDTYSACHPGELTWEKTP